MDNNDSRFERWMRVQAYKHDGNLHRQWSPAFLVSETDEYWALASKCSSVTESDGRKWMTKENAIFILFKKRWMNVIAMFKRGGICYYVNVATPTLLDKGYLKYIDYDLDIKMFPDGTQKTLDENEYERHIQTYGYPADICSAIEKSLIEIKAMMSDREFPFIDENIKEMFDSYLKANQPFMVPKAVK